MTAPSSLRETSASETALPAADPVFTEPFAAAVDYVNDIIETGEGLYLLTGEQGTGKSSVLEYCRDRTTDSAIVLLDTLRRIDVDNLAGLLNDAFNVADSRKRGPRAQSLRYFLKLGTLRAKGTRFILALDDVEEIHSSGAELITALLELKAEQSYLVTIILAGDLHLNALLDRNYRWGIQKLIRDSHEIEPLKRRQADPLIDQIRIRDADVPIVFGEGARRALVRLGSGIPGLMIKLGQRAANLARASGANVVNARMVRGAASGHYRSLSGRITTTAWKSAVALLILLLVPITLIQRNDSDQEFSETPIGGVVDSRPDSAVANLTSVPGLATREDDIALLVSTETSFEPIPPVSAGTTVATSEDNILEPDQYRHLPVFRDRIPSAPLASGGTAPAQFSGFSAANPSRSMLYSQLFALYDLDIPGPSDPDS